MAINAGQMRQVVRIEVQGTAQDASGQPIRTWNLFAKRRAELIATSGREFFEAQQRQARVPTMFRLRHLEGVKPSMRLVHTRDGANRVYNIISAIDPDGLRVETMITTEELLEVVP